MLGLGVLTNQMQAIQYAFLTMLPAILLSGFMDLLPNFLALLGLGTFFITMAAKQFKKVL